MVAVERELSTRSPTPAASAITADAIPLALRRRGASPRQVLAMTFVGLVVLALFASRDLPSWAGRVGDGPLARRARALATDCAYAMESLSLVRPHKEVQVG